MRLIDADRLFHNLERGVRNASDQVFREIANTPTVKAIPVEWIEKFMNRFRLGMVTSDEYVLLHFMLTEWEKENEQVIIDN